MAQCRPGDQDLIPMIDVESTGGLSDEQFCDSLIRFLEMVGHAYRQKPLVYTGRNFYNKHLIGQMDDYPLMVAMYANEPEMAFSEVQSFLRKFKSTETVTP